jgi:photosystem II stability/assembly factor-like uncharacterized protein
MKRREVIGGAGALALVASAWGPSAWAAAETGKNTGAYGWKSVPFGGGGFIAGLVFHPRERDLLYARGDSSGLFRFDPARQSWLALLDHLQRADGDLISVLSVALDPRDANRVYAACGAHVGEWARNGALLASTDRGATWAVHELGIKLGGQEAGRGSGERLQVDPNQPEVLLLGTTRDGLMKSTDRGQRFSKLNFAARHVSLVLFDPASGTAGNPSRTVYVGSHDKPGLYVSHDGGESFAREADTPAQVPQRAVFGPEGTLYVTFATGEPDAVVNPAYATGGSVWKREKNGRWIEITPVPASPGQRSTGYSGVDVDRQAPQRLIVSSMERWGESADIFLSEDGGKRWTALGARSRHDVRPYPWLASFLGGEDSMGAGISDLKFDPFDGERALYGTSFGLWATRNLGAAQKADTPVQWDFLVSNLECTYVPQLRSTAADATLLAVMGNVSGAAWDDVTKTPRGGLFAPCQENNRSVAVAELNPGVVVRTDDQAPGGGYVSTDGAVTWRSFGPSTRLRRSSKGEYLSAGEVALSAKGGFIVWAPERQPALCSRDRAKSWKEVAGWPKTEQGALVPVADRTVEGVFYVHDREGGNILVSVDGGESFKPMIRNLPPVQYWQSAQLVAAPGTVRDLWLALPDGLMHFPGLDDRPRTIKGVAEPWLVALGKGAPGASYHSVYVWGKVGLNGGEPVEGLYRSDDGGNSFVRINDDRHRFGTLSAMAGDPVEYGTVYIAPMARGILVGRPAA